MKRIPLILFVLLTVFSFAFLLFGEPLRERLAPGVFCTELSYRFSDGTVYYVIGDAFLLEGEADNSTFVLLAVPSEEDSAYYAHSVSVTPARTADGEAWIPAKQIPDGALLIVQSKKPLSEEQRVRIEDIQRSEETD